MAITIIKRIVLNVGNARFDIDTHVPILSIWGESGSGKTFLWKSIQAAKERGENGFDWFVCVNYKTDTLDTLQEKIEKSTLKVFVIDDTWHFTPKGDVEEIWGRIQKIRDVIEKSRNQYIFLQSDSFWHSFSDNFSFLVKGEGNTIKSKITDFKSTGR